MAIHGIWLHNSRICLNISKKRGIPYIVHPHGMLDPWAVNNSLWKKKLAGILYENEHLRTANCIRALCLSEVVAVRRYGLKNPICQIANGIDLPQIPVASPAPWHNGTESGKKILLFLGRIHPKKGAS